jgi:hypothetical protein
MLEATIEINTLRLHLLRWVDSTLWRRIIVRWCCQASVKTRLKGRRDKITVSRLFATKRCWVQIGSIKVTPPFNCSIFIWPRIQENTTRGFAAGNRRADGHSRGQKMLSSPRIRTVYTCLLVCCCSFASSRLCTWINCVLCIAYTICRGFSVVFCVVDGRRFRFTISSLYQQNCTCTKIVL